MTDLDSMVYGFKPLEAIIRTCWWSVFRRRRLKRLCRIVGVIKARDLMDLISNSSSNFGMLLNLIFFGFWMNFMPMESFQSDLMYLS